MHLIYGSKFSVKQFKKSYIYNVGSLLENRSLASVIKTGVKKPNLYRLFPKLM